MSSSTSDGPFLVGIVGVAAVLAVTIGTIELAALFAGHPGPPLSGTGIGHGLANWHSHADDPRVAFPAPLQGTLPGPVGVYGALGLVITAVAALGATAASVYGRRTRQVNLDASAAGTRA